MPLSFSIINLSTFPNLEVLTSKFVVCNVLTNSTVVEVTTITSLLFSLARGETVEVINISLVVLKGVGLFLSESSTISPPVTLVLVVGVDVDDGFKSASSAIESPAICLSK